MTVANQRANDTNNDVAQVVVAWARAFAGAFSFSGFSGEPAGNRTQQNSREEIQR
jgi:hypothetical protein